jgi:hypothetical protein
MNVNLKVQKKYPSVGDVIVCENGNYIICYDANSDFKNPVYDLNNMTRVNAFKDLSTISEKDSVYSGSGRIIGMIPHNQVELNRTGGAL